MGDARSEVLLGTFESSTLIACEIQPPEVLGGAPSAKVSWRSQLPGPVLSVTQADLTGDALDEVLVATAHGVHTYQVDVQNIAHLVSAAVAASEASQRRRESFEPLVEPCERAQEGEDRGSEQEVSS